ncbi:hypothetical protein, partial [Sphingomonas sp. DC3200b1]
PVTLLDEGGPFCTPIGGPFWTPIDTHASIKLPRSISSRRRQTTTLVMAATVPEAVGFPESVDDVALWSVHL